MVTLLGRDGGSCGIGHLRPHKPRTLTIKAQSLELFSLLSFYQNETAKGLSQGVLGLRDQMLFANDKLIFFQDEVAS